jgi:hypothetical protein
MAREKNRQRRLRHKAAAAGNRNGFIILGICALVVIGLGYLYVKAQAGIVERDATTLCPESGPTSVTTVIIDRTDTVNPVQRTLLVDKFNELRASVPKGGLLEIYTVNPVKQEVLKPEFSLCNPGDGGDLSQWTSNPRLARKTWDSVFSQPLQTVLDGMLEGGDASQSPIMETIQSVAATSFAPHDDVPKTLVIASDLLQHSANHTQYPGIKPFSEVRSTPGYRQTSANLLQADVRILYLRRETKNLVQGEKHVSFWQDFFAAQNATLSNVISIP